MQDRKAHFEFSSVPCFKWIFPVTPHDNLCGSYYYLNFTVGNIKAQRGHVSCPSHTANSGRAEI